MFGRILVTGYSGFVGPWVLVELRRRFPHAVLFGAARRPARGARGSAGPDRCFVMDLRMRQSVEEVLDAARPDAVVHLASQKSALLHELLEINVAGCDRLLTTLARVAPSARAVVVGSSAEIGRPDGLDFPIGEDARCEPVDDYGITKLAQSAVARRQILLGQDVVQVRPFNLFGPGVPEVLLAGRCVRQLRAAAQVPGPSELSFGPLDARRDYVDVRDVARAIGLALAKSPTGALYHIGSGVSRTGFELVDALIRESGQADVSCRAEAPARPPLVPWQTADSRRAAEVLGWRPAIGWADSIRDIWNHARVPEPEPDLASAK